jgi:hypothetical protein
MPKTSHVSIARLIQRRDAWMKKLAELGPMTRGSLVTAQRGNHTAYQLTVSVHAQRAGLYHPGRQVRHPSALFSYPRPRPFCCRSGSHGQRRACPFGRVPSASCSDGLSPNPFFPTPDLDLSVVDQEVMDSAGPVPSGGSRRHRAQMACPLTQVSYPSA